MGVGGGGGGGTVGVRGGGHCGCWRATVNVRGPQRVLGGHCGCGGHCECWERGIVSVGDHCGCWGEGGNSGAIPHT